MAQIREKYVLVFWLEEPRSADVVLKTQVVPDAKFPIILPKQSRLVVWADGKVYPANVITTGLKKDLDKIKISRDGEIITDVGPDTECVTTRKRAIAVLESRAAKIQATALADLDELVLVSAAGTSKHQAVDRDADQLAEAAAALKTLACRKAPAPDEMQDYVQLGSRSNIYIHREDVHNILRDHRKKPARMFIALIKHLLTPELLKQGCLSYTGRKNETVAIPPDIVKAASSYVTLNAKGKEFQIYKVLANLFGKARAKAKKS